jgi:4a-hydroxytetrahydrobiopterin dehydratase
MMSTHTSESRQPINRDQLLAQVSVALEGSKAMSAEQIQSQLQALPRWVAQGGKLQRTFGFKNYFDTIAFVNAIAWMIHAEDHHPELIVTYNKCEVRWDTHSVGGISLNDFICAAKTDALYEQGSARQAG